MLVSYPAFFYPIPYGYSVVFPDLNLATEGKTYDEAVAMAIECLAAHLDTSRRNNEEVPDPSAPEQLKPDEDGTLVVISFDFDNYVKTHFEKPVKKTLSIPKWLDEMAKARGIKMSKLLQKALKQELKIE